MKDLKRVVLTLTLATFLIAPGPARAFDFGAMVGTLSQMSQGGGGSGATSSEDALAEALKQIDIAKELQRQSVEIKNKMIAALVNTYAMTAFGASASYYQIGAVTNAQDAVHARDVFYQQVSKVNDARVSMLGNLPTPADALAKIQTMNRIGRNSVTELKGLADQGNEELAKSINNLEASFQAFEMSNWMLDKVGGHADQAKNNIDAAIEEFNEKGGSLIVETTKMAGVLALQIVSARNVINDLSSNPLQAITLIPKATTIITDINHLIGVLDAYKEDYNYIESVAGDIRAGADESASIIREGKAQAERATAKIRSIAAMKQELMLLEKSVSKARDKAEQDMASLFDF